jgi:hypothetical protein
MAHIDDASAGDPVISVDTKRKEMVGEYANGGVEWQPAGQPVRVNVHDFVDPELGRAIPYGIYDETNNEGWVSVGDTADTAEFAVNAIRSWWNTIGKPRFPDATRLLITADGGGSNGHRVRLWKTEIARLAAETGLTIRAERDTEWYQKDVKISDTDIASLPLTRHDWHSDWNYTLASPTPND